MIKYTLKTGQSRPLCPVVLFGSPPRHGALCVVIRPSPSSLGLTRCCSASWDSKCPRAVANVIIGLTMPMFDYPHCGEALHLCVGLFASWQRPTCCRWAP